VAPQARAGSATPMSVPRRAHHLQPDAQRRDQPSRRVHPDGCPLAGRDPGEGEVTVKRGLYTAEHEMFRDTVKQYVAREVVDHLAAWDEQRLISRDAWRAAGRRGLIGLSGLEDCGGGRGRRLPLPQHDPRGVRHAHQRRSSRMLLSRATGQCAVNAAPCYSPVRP
jgi:alkylation response protein AidB-like acyl-CoA dehydrogenase